MISKAQRILDFELLAQRWDEQSAAWISCCQRAIAENAWFTMDNIQSSARAIKYQFLDAQKLGTWMEQGCNPVQSSTIGIIGAGNIPMVSFHDVLCVLASGHQLHYKPSSKDALLIPFVLDLLVQINPAWKAYIQLADRLTDADAIIATGSNNSLRYFEFYFGNKPHIFRHNRTSVGVLVDPSEAACELFMQDVLTYFGLGCRNVSKVYLPEGFDLNRLFAASTSFGTYRLHNKYENNFKHQATMMMMNKRDFWTNDIFILREDGLLFAPISVLNFEFYTSLDEVQQHVSESENLIQCYVSDKAQTFKNQTPLGQTQQPSLTDYADGVDVLQFLNELSPAND